MISCCPPNRELLREYDRGGPGVRGFWNAALLGPGLLNLGGPAPTLFEKPEGVMEPFRPEGVTEPFRLGVGASEGCLRNGDSGRGSEGLAGGLNCGLGARAFGPRDREKLGIEGVSGLCLGRSRVEALNLLPYEGVVGVGGRLESGVNRFFARWTGRKMPEPGIDVSK